MDLSDLLEDHTVMYQINCDTSHADASPTIMDTVEWNDPIITNGEIYDFITVFSFDTEVITGAAAYVVMKKLIYPYPFYFKGKSDTVYTCAILLNGTQVPDSGLVSVYIRHGIMVSGGYLASGYFNLKVGTPYALAIGYEKESGYAKVNYGLIELDPLTGKKVSFVVSLGDSSTMTGSAAAMAPQEVETRVLTYAHQRFSMKIYEGCYAGVRTYTGGSFVPNLFHSLWSGLRYMNYTYYDHWKRYLLPPANVMDGSAYDRTKILNEVIDDLQDDVVTIQTDLDTANTNLATANADLVTANANIDTLQTDLDTANATIDANAIELAAVHTAVDAWPEDFPPYMIAELEEMGFTAASWAEAHDFAHEASTNTTSIGEFFSAIGDRLTHLVEVVKDPAGAITTNMKRMVSDKFAEWF